MGNFGLVAADTATSLSLVMTELCQNAIEHGFDSSSGEVVVHPHREGDELVIDVLDGGVGIPEGFDIDNTSSLGLSIVRTLVDDMGGRFELGNRGDHQGSRARVVIPVPQA